MDPARTLRLATRGSMLALRQVEEVARRLKAGRPELEVEAVVVRTTGDRLAEVSLDRLGGQGIFAKEVQLAVLEGRADAAVHSAKDLPSEGTEGLSLSCVPPRADPRDVLVGGTLDGLPAGALVATGSARRRAQLAHLRPDLTFTELRGNMGTRLSKVEDGAVDVVVTAQAALDRLGQGSRASEVLSPTVMLPQVGQGALAVECRSDDAATAGLLETVDDEGSHRAVAAERAALAALGANCTMPFGALSRLEGAEVAVETVLASADGRVVVRSSARGSDPEATGRAAVRALFDHEGGGAIEGVGRPEGVR